EGAMFLQRLQRIPRAGGLETAAAARHERVQQRRKEPAVKGDEHDQRERENTPRHAYSTASGAHDDASGVAGLEGRRSAVRQKRCTQVSQSISRMRRRATSTTSQLGGK